MANSKSSPSTSVIKKANIGMHRAADEFGNFLVEGFHLLALFAIGGATVWAAVTAFLGMIDSGQTTVEDLLLLFIYLEIGAMVGIYFKTNRMPVRFLIYVAITALTRMMIGFINIKHVPDIGVFIVSGAILLLAFAALVLRFASHKYPSTPSQLEQPTD